jgi:NAD(P)-dependent dehydrogenase (short-subunit alcohol dehydrogenase family)
MFEGLTALVTGSTSGIGLGIATAFAARRANVILNGFGDASSIETLRAGLEAEHGVRVRYDDADLSRQDAIESMVGNALGEFGAIDILVNNAGIQFVSPVSMTPRIALARSPSGKRLRNSSAQAIFAGSRWARATWRVWPSSTRWSTHQSARSGTTALVRFLSVML